MTAKLQPGGEWEEMFLDAAVPRDLRCQKDPQAVGLIRLILMGRCQCKGQLGIRAHGIDVRGVWSGAVPRIPGPTGGTDERSRSLG